MANVTLTIDDQLLKRARIRALEHGTSVNAIVRDYLEAYAGEGPERRALEVFEDIVDSADVGSGPEGRTLTRAELYD